MPIVTFHYMCELLELIKNKEGMEELEGTEEEERGRDRKVCAFIKR